MQTILQKNAKKSAINPPRLAHSTANTATGGAAAARQRPSPAASPVARLQPSSAAAPVTSRGSCGEAEAEQQSERNSAAEARGAAFLQLLRALARRGVRRSQAGGNSEARAVHLNHKKRLPAKNSKLMKKGRRFKLQFNIILIILKFDRGCKFLPQGAGTFKKFR